MCFLGQGNLENLYCEVCIEETIPCVSYQVLFCRIYEHLGFLLDLYVRCKIVQDRYVKKTHKEYFQYWKKEFNRDCQNSVKQATNIVCIKKTVYKAENPDLCLLPYESLFSISFSEMSHSWALDSSQIQCCILGFQIFLTKCGDHIPPKRKRISYS